MPVFQITYMGKGKPCFFSKFFLCHIAVIPQSFYSHSNFFKVNFAFHSLYPVKQVWNAGSSGIVGKGADFPMRSREEITADLEKLVSELMEDMEGRDEPGYQYG